VKNSGMGWCLYNDCVKIAAQFGILAALLCLWVAMPAAAQYTQPPASSASQTPGSTSTGENDQLKPTYPGEPLNKPPIEAKIGPVALRVYGTVLLNISLSDSDEVGQDIPLWPFPSSTPITLSDGTVRRAGSIHDTIFTARQSVFGVVLNPATPSDNGWNTSALVEMDFFGVRPADTNLPEDRVLNQPRLRKAYFQLQKGHFKLVAGQDDIIISPLNPVSLSHVAVPLGYTNGNLFGWLPQVRAEFSHDWGKTSALFQIGLLRPAFGDPHLGDVPPSGISIDSSSGLGERASQPFYQSRMAISHPMHGSPFTLGVAGHYGQERIGATRTIDSWAFAFDYRIPIFSKLFLRGEGYLGSNLVPFGGGIVQGVAAVAAPPPAPANTFNLFHKIGDGGGWSELTFIATQRNIFYLGYTEDNPVHHELLPGTTKSRNAMAWFSYFRKLTPGTTIAVEYSNWLFQTTGFTGNVPTTRGAGGRGNVLNIALAYQF
jgi:hypothetical protein